MCEFCEGKSPLTNKVFDDQTLFDDMRSTRIEYFGKMPVLVSEVKAKYFDIFKTLTSHQKEFLPTSWAIPFNWCPICGEPLSEEAKEIQAKREVCIN